MSGCVVYDIPSDSVEKEDLFNELGAQIRDGKLVAFPTETVYGLGANALDTRAVLSIFTTKGRPLTDPVICHVASAEDGLDLLVLPEPLKPAYFALAKAFWPGPLSIVGKAADKVPAVVTANTGSVAVRCPNNQTALALIRASQRPIAAPSANKFGCISPTAWRHVSKAFAQDQLAVVKGAACQVGIESTVAKLELDEATGLPCVVVLRVGAVTAEMLRECLSALGVPPANVRLSDKLSVAPVSKATTAASLAAVHAAHDEVLEQARRILAALGDSEDGAAVPGCELQTGEEAPGMLLTHYAPSVPTYLLKASEGLLGEAEAPPVALDRALIVDVFDTQLSEPVAAPQVEKKSLINLIFGACSGAKTVPTAGSQFAGVVRKADVAVDSEMDESTPNLMAAYHSQETLEAAHLLFAAMHQADETAAAQGLEAIYLVAPPWLGEVADVSVSEKEGLARAVLDRLFRAASGRTLRAAVVEGQVVMEDEQL